MKKFIKSLIVFALTLLVTAGIVALSACGSGKLKYTVNVECEDAPLVLGGLEIQLKNSDGAVVAKADAAGGSASFELEKGEYTVILVEKAGFEGLIEDYVYAIKSISESSPTADIRLTPAEGEETEEIEYNVTLVKPDGTPVPLVSVQLCGGPTGSCYSKRTDENGVAAFSLPAGEYEVHIEQKISGFTFDNNEYKMGSTGGNLTVLLKAE